MAAAITTAIGWRKHHKPQRKTTKRPNFDYENVKSDRDFVLDSKALAYRPSLLLPDLSEDGKAFFNLVHNGDVIDVIDFISHQENFDINCQNYQGFTALHIAVNNEDVPMVEYFAQFDEINIGDCVLHAVLIGNCRIMEILLDKLKNTDRSETYLPDDYESTEFSVDMTPLILAAHQQHYECIKVLMKRGHRIEKPHSPKCFCGDVCLKLKERESLVESIARLNCYKALASPAYICQSSDDPILTAFELSLELTECAFVEKEFHKDYTDLAASVKKFPVLLLDQCRSTEEVEELLEWSKDGIDEGGQTLRFPRLDKAMDCQQKEFVAHHSCQQVLRMAWVGKWIEWKAYNDPQKLAHAIFRIFTLPLASVFYLVAPYTKLAQSLKSPMNKFLYYSASYMAFLVMLFIQNDRDRMDFVRGPPNTGLEWAIAIYVFGLLWKEIKQVWGDGIKKYLSQKWNWYDMIMMMVFLLTFILWVVAYHDVRVNGNKFLERKYWEMTDPTLLAECTLAIATIMAFGRVLQFFQVNNTLGPLQVSISKMFIDVGRFLCIFFIVIFSFSTGLSKLYTYYGGQLIIDSNGIKKPQLGAFTTFTDSVKTLFWAIFAMSPINAADVVISPYTKQDGNETIVYINKHEITQTVGALMFGAYHVIAIIVLLNMLIAMMTNSYQMVFDNADVEWKFARTEVWQSFLEEGGTLPPPFNLIPSPKSFSKFAKWLALKCLGREQAHCSLLKCCYIDDENARSLESKRESYQLLMSKLIQRYLGHKKIAENKQEHNDVDTSTVHDNIHQELKELKQMLKRFMGENTTRSSKTNLRSDRESSPNSSTGSLIEVFL
ncbi:unnamed protein product [Owenia fusiformis]|uniref:Transient receptor ion channel domain-containing protein n=1 Tax=Owenia fusiformis TaxID=6347 RepID=A0A8S4NW45_OWEFU|nr:unnamed protein product [Owenia fusiformis]